MGCFSVNLFWGCLLILWGLSIVLGDVFHIHIPVFRLVFAFALIYFGLRILLPNTFRRPWCPPGGMAAQSGKPGQNNVIFGRGSIDLSSIPLDKDGGKAEVNAIFSSARVRLGAGQAVRVQATAAFGHVRLPGGRVEAFGDTVYDTKDYSADKPFLALKVNAIFGHIEVVQE